MRHDQEQLSTGGARGARQLRKELTGEPELPDDVPHDGHLLLEPLEPDCRQHEWNVELFFKGDAMNLALRPNAVPKRTRHHAACTCVRDTLETPWKADLCMILHVRDEEWSRTLLSEFLDDQGDEIARVLRRAKRIARLGREDDAFALSYFGQALMKMVEHRWRARTGSGTSEVFNYSRNLPTILESETRSCIRDDRRRGLLDGTAGVPGGAVQDRKAGHVKKSRQLFEIEYGHTPENDELVAFHNERMYSTRKDAARQSVLITQKDLQVPQAVPLDLDSTEGDSRLAVRGTGDAVALEWSDRIAAVLERCKQLDHERERSRTRRLGREPVRSADVARVYFAHHAIGEFPTRSEIVDQLGITEPAARRELGPRLDNVLAVAREIFADYLYDR